MTPEVDKPIAALPSRNAWPRGFPDADIHAPESRVKKHDLYGAAKAGDVEASVELVLDVINAAAVERLRQYRKLSPIIVPVHGIEGVSVNTIPAVLAACLCETLNFDLETAVVQTTKAAHTGASGWWRLQSHALFRGEVVPGRPYILIDDFLGMGGTFANLRGYIEAKGGMAIHAQALTGKPRSAKLALQTSTLQALREKHGEIEPWWRAKFGYGFDALTQSEALYLSRAEDADTIRRRLAEAASEGDR
jgi:hypoxanthine-guanine phosphoribosyltransferase